MNESFLNAQEIVEQITAAFYQHLEAVKQNVGELNKLNSSYGKLPSDYLKTIKSITDAQVKQAKAERELANTSAALARQKVAETALLIKENALLRDNLKTQQVQEKQVRATGGAYRLFSADLTAARNSAKDLAVDLYLLKEAGEQNTSQYALLESQLNDATAAVLKMDTAAKTIDKSLGQSNRFVGEYERGFNGLGVSINQLTRELPAFAVNANTGFLAISNNLPMLFDELSRIRLENEKLVAQGKETIPAMNQLAKAFFSWNTALSLGVTLLTLYGGKLTEWVGTLFGAAEGLENLKENQDKLNASQRTGLKSTVETRTALKENIAIARDLALTDTEREIALKKLRAEYPFYFKNLTDQQILAGETAKAEEEIIKALNKRAQANEAANVIAENDKAIIDLREEERLLNINYDKRRKELKIINDRVSALTESRPILRGERQEQLKAEDAFNAANSKRIDNQKVINALTNQSASKQAEILKLRKESIGLDYQEDKQKEKELQIQELVDFEASAYALAKTRLENEARINEEILKNESENLDRRQLAADEYQRNIRDIAELNLQENLRLIKKGTADEIAEYRRRAAEGEITQSNASAATMAIQKQAEYDSLLAYEDYAEELRGVTKSLNENLKGVWEGISDQQRNNTVDSSQLDALRQLNLEAQNLTANSDYKKFKDLEDRKTEITRRATEERIQIELQRVAADISRIQTEAQLTTETEKKAAMNAELERLTSKQIGLQKDLSQVEQERLNKTTALTLELKRATDDYINSFSEGFLSDAGLGSLNQFFKIGEDGLTEFERRFAGAGDDIGKQFAVTFNAITEVAQEAFAFMNQASQQQFDLEYERLEKRRTIALKFAGENQDAQDEINRQYEERQRDIKRRELQAQKDQAIFNAVINTAQGVTAALATANIPLSIIIGALGAAQVAFIAQQQIPAFAEGGITGESGNILVNDAKGSNYKEVAVTPSGQTIKPSGRNRILNVPKGTRIFKNYAEHENALNSILNNTGIAPNASGLNRTGSVTVNNSGGITAQELESVMMKTVGSMAQESHTTIFDEHGYTNYVEKGHSRREDRNNYLEVKRKKYGRG